MKYKEKKLELQATLFTLHITARHLKTIDYTDKSKSYLSISI